MPVDPSGGASAQAGLCSPRMRVSATIMTGLTPIGTPARGGFIPPFIGEAVGLLGGLTEVWWTGARVAAAPPIAPDAEFGSRAVGRLDRALISGSKTRADDRKFNSWPFTWSPQSRSTGELAVDNGSWKLAQCLNRPGRVARHRGDFRRRRHPSGIGGELRTQHSKSAHRRRCRIMIRIRWVPERFAR